MSLSLRNLALIANNPYFWPQKKGFCVASKIPIRWLGAFKRGHRKIQGPKMTRIAFKFSEKDIEVLEAVTRNGNFSSMGNAVRFALDELLKTQESKMLFGMQINTEKVIKMSVNLPEEAIDVLRNLASERGVTVTEVLRHAIGLEKYFDQVQKDQGKILVEKSDGEIRELVFR